GRGCAPGGRGPQPRSAACRTWHLSGEFGCGYSEAAMRRKVTRLTLSRVLTRRRPAPRRHPLGLRVTALDDEEIELGSAFAQRGRGLVLRRAVAIERDPIARKLEHDGAPTHVTLHHLALAAAHQEAPAIFSEGRHVRDHVGLVTLGLGDIDVRDPIAFAGRGCRL